MGDAIIRVKRCGETKVAVSPDGYLGPEWSGYLNAVKRSGGRFKDKAVGHILPADQVPTLIAELRVAGFDPEKRLDTSEVEQLLREAAGERRILEAAAEERIQEVDEALAEEGHSLFAFQREGVVWIAKRKAALLGDEMGLGKTIQLLCASPEGSPIICVVPAAAKYGWKAESQKWRPDIKPTVLEGRGALKKWPRSGEMLILNYELLPDEPPKGKPVAGTVLIGDEIHYTKNNKAIRTKRWRKLVRAVRDTGGWVWGASGTPLLRSPIDLWNVLTGLGLHKQAFGTFDHFKRAFNAYQGRWGLVWGDPDEGLTVPALRKVSLIRKREEVLPDLPVKFPAQDIPVRVDPDTLAELDDIVMELENQGIDVENATLATLRSAVEAPGFCDMSGAMERLAVAKAPAALKEVEMMEEAGEPLVVFCAHRGPIEAIAKRKGWEGILGGVAAEDRHDIVTRFQDGELRGVACTIGAAGVALTLTRAHVCLFIDQTWSPEVNRQAEDRLCRIGQTRGVVIKRLVADHPLERALVRRLDEKRRMVDGSVNASARSEVEADDLAEELESAARYGPKEREQARRKSRRPARTEAERWAAKAMGILTGLDPDRAAELNDKGWSKVDGEPGRELLRRLNRYDGLTEKEWRWAVNICKKYHRQVGECPDA